MQREHDTGEKNPSLLDQLGNPRGEVLEAFCFHWGRARIRRVSRASVKQIKKILQSVPDVFPEDLRLRQYGAPRWKHDPAFYHMSPQQQQVYLEIQELGNSKVTGLQLEDVIQSAVVFRDSPDFRETVQERIAGKRRVF